MRALFDVNVLLALFDPAHVHHGTAKDWRKDSGHEWASCPLTQNGFLRILSGRGYPNPLTLAEAMAAFHRQLELPGHEFWSDSVSLFDETIFNRDRLLGASQLTDIYLLALAVQNGGCLVTFDRSISPASVRNAEARHLVILR